MHCSKMTDSVLTVPGVVVTGLEGRVRAIGRLAKHSGVYFEIAFYGKGVPAVVAPYQVATCASFLTFHHSSLLTS
jgi:hypothetical protein